MMKDTIKKHLEAPERLIKASIKDLQSRLERAGGRVEGSGWRRIPSICWLHVPQSEMNLILEGSGFQRKIRKPIKRGRDYEISEEQDKANRYMANEIKCMRWALRRNRPDIFWARAAQNMKKSKAFRMSAINTVCHRWYKSWDIQDIIKVALEVEKIISQDITDLRSFRVEIPKGNPEEVLKFYKDNPGKEWPGKMRPLGVPTKPWRVVLHMWNNFLVMFVEEELKKFNHAYMPGKGTITALATLVKEVVYSKYIYEFDIKGFFNNVSIEEVMKLLKEKGMPKKLRETLEGILWQEPKNLKKEASPKLEDLFYSLEHYDVLLAREEEIIREMGVLKNERLIPVMAKIRLQEKLMEIDNQRYDDYLHLSREEKRRRDTSLLVNEKLKAVMERWSPGQIRMDRENKRNDLGLPQGAAPSTILSLLTLEKWYKDCIEKGVKLLMYADDGILYSDKPFEIGFMRTPKISTIIRPPEGYEFALDKSKWLRKEVWHWDRFRFLGVDYLPNEGIFEGHTRNGSRLKFRPSEDNMMEFLREVNSYGFSGDKMWMLAKSTIFGQALSRLYEGSWDKVDHVWKVVHNKKSYWGKYHSLEALEKSKYLTRVASSISCLWLEKLVAFSMGKIEKKEFKKEQLKHPFEATARIKLAASAERENLRRISLNKAANKIDEADINESVKWQNTWDSRAPWERW